MRKWLICFTSIVVLSSTQGVFAGDAALQYQLQRLQNAVNSRQASTRSNTGANQVGDSSLDDVPASVRPDPDQPSPTGPTSATIPKLPSAPPTNAVSSPNAVAIPGTSIPAAPGTRLLAQAQQPAATAAPAPSAAETPLISPSKQAEMAEEIIRHKAYGGMAKQVLPMTPMQIQALRALYNSTQNAASTVSHQPPRPTSTSVMVNLAPGATPPIIRLSAGFVTSLVFLDATGAPWPISAYDLGNPKAYNIQWDKKGNTLLVQALSMYKAGNLAVLLKGMNTPVMITLMPGQKAVDYRVDLRVPGMGPQASMAQAGMPDVASPYLMKVLDGIPPEGATSVNILGCNTCQAWKLGGKLLLRTRLIVLSPGWISIMSSADGMHAYELQETPLILASHQGRTVHLSVEGL